MSKPIYVFESLVSEKAKRYANEVLNNGWIGLGKKTDEFEEKFAKYVNVKYAVGLNSATSALHLALLYSGVEKDDIVITNPMTFVSTNAAILYCGAIPRFIDSDGLQFKSDISGILNELDFDTTGRIKAIILVHYAGYPYLKNDIKFLKNKYPNVKIIIDASHAVGAKYEDNSMVGSIGDFNIFSLHAVKNISTPDGGVLTTNSKEAYKIIKKLRWLGIDKSTYDRTIDDSNKYKWTYDVSGLGYKYHMNDLTASIALAHLEDIEEFNHTRRMIINEYVNKLCIDVYKPDLVTGSGHMAIVKIDDHIDRDEVILKLKNEYDIHPGVHYVLNNEYNTYKRYMNKTPILKYISDKVITLPCHLKMSNEDVSKVIESFNKIIDELKLKNISN